MKTATDSGSKVDRVERLIDAAAQGVNATVLRFPGWLTAGFWFCVVIAIVVVIRRMIALSTAGTSGAPPELSNLDAWFRAHAVLTWVHISVALAFVLLLPFVFRVSAAKPGALGNAFFALGAMTGATAYGMSRYAVGGWLERSAVLVFDSLFLVSLARAYAMQRQGNVEKQQVWMIRAVAVLLGIATTRPVMGAFFATERLSRLTPAKFFGIAFWIGFSINTIVIELWLRSAVRRSRA
jgi:hypothetical protein